ncbi:MAG: NfeD family protein [Erysipelotrichaceae bacterium]|nr:NfeD family protein [Erysipelotrichaceae bacterium]
MSMAAVWTLILVVSIVIEVMTIDLVSIWFSVGAVVALVSHLLGLNETGQIIIFIIVSLICIIASRPIVKKYLKGNIVRTNLDRVIGKHCLVTETITPDQKGEVKVMGNLWSATSLNNEVITAGQYAEVLSIEGAHVVVKKLEMGVDR